MDRGEEEEEEEGVSDEEGKFVRIGEMKCEEGKGKGMVRTEIWRGSK